MQIQVTEHKSHGTLNPIPSAVRVFVDRDYTYGYFVPEDKLYALLTPKQQAQYLAEDAPTLDVSLEVAEQIIAVGYTIYAKQKLRKPDA